MPSKDTTFIRIEVTPAEAARLVDKIAELEAENERLEELWQACITLGDSLDRIVCEKVKGSIEWVIAGNGGPLAADISLVLALIALAREINR